VRAARVARLATVNPSGGVDLVPITFGLVADDVIVTAIDHKPKTTTSLARLRNVRAHPEVTMLVDHYDDDWTELWWVRVRGVATIVESPDARWTAAIAALVDRYRQYATRPPSGPAMLIQTTEWRGWAAQG
jgi:PPOX class probable F420-dependent enzyme